MLKSADSKVDPARQMKGVSVGTIAVDMNLDVVVCDVHLARNAVQVQVHLTTLTTLTPAAAKFKGTLAEKADT